MEERLRKFTGIVDAGSFTAAAERLHISQPALTTAIKKLERELKTELLIRTSQGVLVTPAGKLAYDAAKALDMQASNLQRTIAHLQNQKTPFTIGAIDAIADLLFVHGTYLQRLQQAAHLSLTIDNSTQILRLLEHDDVEFGLIAKPMHIPKTFTYTLLGQEPLVLVCAPGHEREAQANIAHRQISTFLAYNQQSQTYRLIADYFAQQSIRITPTFYSTSPHILLQLARAGRGVAVLPYLLVEPEITAGRLVHLYVRDDPFIAREIIAVHRSGRVLHPEAAGLCTYATSQLTKLAKRVGKG